MGKSFSESYKQAGVDVTAGYQSVELIKEAVKSTYNEGVVSDLGGFGGLYALNTEKIKEPILVSGTDGVGTKLKLAFLMEKHDTIGQDCVAMCVNDIICCGARPLFFLDYMALRKKCARNKSLARIADDLETDTDEIRSLYEVISKNPEKTVEELYQIISGKAQK